MKVMCALSGDGRPGEAQERGLCHSVCASPGLPAKLVVVWQVLVCAGWVLVTWSVLVLVAWSALVMVGGKAHPASLGKRAPPLGLCWSWSAWESWLCHSVCAPRSELVLVCLRAPPQSPSACLDWPQMFPACILCKPLLAEHSSSSKRKASKKGD